MRVPNPNRLRAVLIASVRTAAGADAFLRASERAELLGALLVDGDRGAVEGVRILGPAESLPAIHRRLGFDLAILCLPPDMGERTARISAALSAMGVEQRRLPTPDEAIAAGPALAFAPQPGRGPLDPEALIGRPGREMDEAARRRAERAIRARRVLITGAGGSIGSELALRCAELAPRELVLMDRTENALFEIDRRLRERHPGVARRAMLHDVVDERATLAWLRELAPDVVFHAAAHKHVPIMQDHPSQAINNNVFGTRAVADAALACGAERFVMISTDKAVNPTSVMGATKRIAELYVAGLAERAGGRTRFSMVRFGNVLGSAGSVADIWDRQIGEGGPLTVTHPEMTRYFMTIPEAATLVIQAGSLSEAEAGGASAFVLDMGEPIRIVGLAERFIRLRGLEPRMGGGLAGARAAGTVDIVFTGARPGEKLHEELAHASEELRPTSASGVLAWAPQPGWRPEGDIDEMIEQLGALRVCTDRRRVIEALAAWFPALVERARTDTEPAAGAA